jgi:hypothetical protein
MATTTKTTAAPAVPIARSREWPTATPSTPPAALRSACDEEKVGEPPASSARPETATSPRTPPSTVRVGSGLVRPAMIAAPPSTHSGGTM